MSDPEIAALSNADLIGYHRQQLACYRHTATDAEKESVVKMVDASCDEISRRILRLAEKGAVAEPAKVSACTAEFAALSDADLIADYLRRLASLKAAYGFEKAEFRRSVERCWAEILWRGLKDVATAAVRARK